MDMNPVPRRTVALLISLASAMALTASANAGGWTSPAVLQAGCKPHPLQCTVEPAPHAAVNARGQAVVAWAIVDHQNYLIRAATATTSGHFGKAVTIGKGLRPTVVLTDRGTSTVFWSDKGTLRFARAVSDGKFSAARVLTPKAGKIGDDDPKPALQPDGSIVVVYQNAYRNSAGRFITRLRSVVLDSSAHPSHFDEIGLGSLGRDSFRASANGQLAACCVDGPPVEAPAASSPGSVTTFAPAYGWKQLTPPITKNQDVETVATGRGDVLLGTVDVEKGGEAGSLGTPGLRRAGPDGIFGPQLLAPVSVAHLAFGPVVAIDGSGRSVLVYQEKDKAAAFSRDAPVYAVTAAAGEPLPATRQKLDSSRAYQPAVRPYGSGAVAAWETGKGTWGVALERDGRFTKAKAPAGGPSSIGEDFAYNRDMATRGRYIVLTWTAKDGSVRASRGTL
jgi:hypothetical protein